MSELARLIDLGNLMVEQQAEIDRLEEELKAAKENFRRTEREDLPDLMDELGLKEFTLSTGEKIEVVPDVITSIPEAKKPKAHKWLIDNNFGGIIKTAVKIEFGRGERELAAPLIDDIKKTCPGREVGISESVHASTLKSFVKERLEKGDDIPFDLFGIIPFNRAKMPTKKKG